MDTERIPGKAIAVVIVVFLFLGGVHLWWQEEDAGTEGVDRELVIDETQLGGDGQKVSFGADGQGDPETRRRETQRLLQILASDASLDKRRSAALHLQYLADERAQDGLLEALKAEDDVIARRCAETLLNIWQRSESPSVNRLMKKGVAAFEDAQYERAMELFEMCLELQPTVSDLHRLRAEILLSRGKVDGALEATRKARDIQPANFMALYIRSQCYLRKGEGERALQNVEEALAVYPAFKPARKLKEKIISLQKAGEL